MATDTRALDPPLNVGLIDQFTWREAGITVHGWPSNFYIEPDGTNVEAEYQLEKMKVGGLNPWKARLLLPRMYENPGVSKKIGRTFDMTKAQLREWDSTKVDVMRGLVEKKAADHEEFHIWLLSTGDTKLVEGNWWHDQFWGSCQCNKHFYRAGRNELGKILMGVRDDVRGSVGFEPLGQKASR